MSDRLKCPYCNTDIDSGSDIGDYTIPSNKSNLMRCPHCGKMIKIVVTVTFETGVPNG